MTSTKTIKKPECLELLEPECKDCSKETYDEGINAPCLRAVALPYKYFEELIGCPIYRKTLSKIGRSMAFLIVEEEIK